VAPAFEVTVMRMRTSLYRSITTFCATLVTVVVMCSEFVVAPTAHAQNVSIGSFTANASALLELVSTTKGLLIPRMTTAQKLAVVAPATGDFVFDRSFNEFYFYDGTQWVPLLSAGNGWLLTGNSGTSPGTNFLGTIDSVSHIIKTNSINRIMTYDSGSELLYSRTDSAMKLQFQTPNGSNTTSLMARNPLRNVSIPYQLPDTGGGLSTVLYNDGTGKLFWGHYGIGANTLGISTLPTLQHDSNNYDLVPRYGEAIYRLSSSANYSVTGIAGGWDGRVVILINVNTTQKSIYLENENTNSIAINRIKTGKNGQIQLNQAQACWLLYDGVDSRWRAISMTP
jgi:hypothetical protein